MMRQSQDFKVIPGIYGAKLKLGSAGEVEISDKWCGLMILLTW